MRARLTITTEPEETPLVYDLDTQQLVTLGRNQGNTVVLHDEHASRWHAEMIHENGQWHIQDLGTRNGTLVNGERIGRERVLASGQEITIGATRLHFTCENSEALAPTVVDLDGLATTSEDSTVLRPDELTALYKFMAASLKETDPRELVRHALETVHTQTQATVTGFLSLDQEHPLPKTILPESAVVDVPLSRYLTQKVQSEGVPVWLKPTPESPAKVSESLLLFTDALCVPLQGDESSMGALHVYRAGRVFSQRDLHFCEVLVGHLATSLRLLRVRRTLEAENSRLRSHVPVPDRMIGDSPSMQELRRLIGLAASRTFPVLISGESGVGKELVALALHRQSSRRNEPLVVVNSPAITPTLLEAEFFGYKKSAFTGADRDHLGLFQQADEGILFMDEIGELSLDGQAKLLRVMDGKGFRQVGGTAEIKVDVRIVAATNRDLEREVKEGRFREDLYYRLRVIPILVPPLRNHPEDIPALVDYYLGKVALECHRQVTLTEAARDRLQHYSWPGNVRQLRTVLEAAVALNESDTIDAGDLGLSGEAPARESPSSLNLDELEARTIRQALDRTQGNITQAARLLGIVRDTLASKMKKFGIEKQ